MGFTRNMSDVVRIRSKDHGLTVEDSCPRLRDGFAENSWSPKRDLAQVESNLWARKITDIAIHEGPLMQMYREDAEREYAALPWRVKAWRKMRWWLWLKWMSRLHDWIHRDCGDY